MASPAQIDGTKADSYIWQILLCVKERSGYGAFTLIMPHPPVIGHSVEIYDTPEDGNLLGDIIRVCEVIRCGSVNTENTAKVMGVMSDGTVKPASLVFQVLVNLRNSSLLGGDFEGVSEM